MYQLCLNAHRNPACRPLLQKLLPLAWRCSSHQLSVEHSPGHTSPADMLEDFIFSLLDHQGFQMQMLRAYSMWPLGSFTWELLSGQAGLSPLPALKVITNFVVRK